MEDHCESDSFTSSQELVLFDIKCDLAIINNCQPFDYTDYIRFGGVESRWFHIIVRALFQAASSNDVDFIKRYIPAISPGLRGSVNSLYSVALQSKSTAVVTYLFDLAKQSYPNAWANMLLDELDHYGQGALGEVFSFSRITSDNKEEIVNILKIITIERANLQRTLTHVESLYDFEKDSNHPGNVVLKAQRNRVSMLSLIISTIAEIASLSELGLQGISTMAMSQCNLASAIARFPSLLSLAALAAACPQYFEESFQQHPAYLIVMDYTKHLTIDMGSFGSDKSKQVKQVKPYLWNSDKSRVELLSSLFQLLAREMLKKSTIDTLDLLSLSSEVHGVLLAMKSSKILASYHMSKNINTEDIIMYCIMNVIDTSSAAQNMLGMLNENDKRRFYIYTRYLLSPHICARLAAFSSLKLVAMMKGQPVDQKAWQDLFTYAGDDELAQRLLHKKLTRVMSADGSNLPVDKDGVMLARPNPMLATLLQSLSLPMILLYFHHLHAVEASNIEDVHALPIPNDLQLPIGTSSFDTAFQEAKRQDDSLQLSDFIKSFLKQDAKDKVLPDDYDPLTSPDKTALAYFIQLVVLEVERLARNNTMNSLAERLVNQVQTQKGLLAYVTEVRSEMRSQGIRCDKQVKFFLDILKATIPFMTLLDHLNFVESTAKSGEHSRGSETSEEASATASRILYAEDEDAMRDMTTKTLTGQGHEVVPVSDGIRAITQFRQDMRTANLGFSKFLLDRHMPPGMGGLCTLELLRSAEMIFGIKTAEAWIHTADPEGLQDESRRLGFDFVGKSSEQRKSFFRSRSKQSNKFFLQKTLPESRPAKQETTRTLALGVKPEELMMDATTEHFIMVKSPISALQQYWQALKNSAPFEYFFVNPDTECADEHDVPLNPHGVAKIIAAEDKGINIVAISSRQAPKRLSRLGYTCWVSNVSEFFKLQSSKPGLEHANINLDILTAQRSSTSSDDLVQKPRKNFLKSPRKSKSSSDFFAPDKDKGDKIRRKPAKKRLDLAATQSLLAGSAGVQRRRRKKTDDEQKSDSSQLAKLK